MNQSSMRWLPGLLLLGHVTSSAAAEGPCGADTPCQVEAGEYHLVLPDRWDGSSALPAVVFFHGHGSSGKRVAESKGLRSSFVDAGYLLIAPTGSNWPGHKATGWPARLDSNGRRDDIAFTSRVLEDVARRLPLDRERVLVSGFSSGASMAWHLGCHGGERFAGFATVAGGLRRPIPSKRCDNGPFRLLHFHGFKDGQVPLEGRGIRDWHQGDVFESFAVARTTNECRSNPTRFDASGIYQCRIWEGCASGNDLQFCLHEGGHNLPRGWAKHALRWFEGDGEG